jgi:hypothetical protein
VLQIITLDNDRHFLCPDCHTRINAGTAGTAQYEKRHKNSKACQKNLEIFNRQRASKAKPQTLLDLFQRKPKPQPVPSKVAAPRPIVPISSVTRPTLAKSTSPQLNYGCPHALDLLHNLDKLIKSLPLHIPEATSHDKWVEFNCDPSSVVCSPEDAWEVIDPMLNRALGFGITPETVSKEVRRGNNGVQALSRFLRYFVIEKGIKGGLLEGKIGVLVNAIKLA